MKLACVALSIFGLLCFYNLNAQNKKPRALPEPGWITKVAVDYNASSLDKEAEDGYIDLDYEKQVSLPAQCVYVRRSLRILSEAGVQNASEISISFDPSYQQLI